MTNHNGRKESNMMTQGELMFVKDISKLFRISANTLRRRRWREKTGIPLRKVGRSLCGIRSDVEEWFRKGYKK